MSILAFAAYIVIVITASGTLRCPLIEKDGRKYIDRRNTAAWGLALLSTFGLPWSGIPLSSYFGAGSWMWFPFAGISMCALRDDGRKWGWFRRFIAIANVAAIMTAIYLFMYENGIPGDIPGIEGVGAIHSLEGISKKLIPAYLCFLISCTVSFLPVYSRLERASVMLSFSYSSFLTIAFLPPARMLLPGLMPGTAIIMDAAAYFVWALLIHIFIMDSFSESAASAWSYSYAALNAAVTAAGIYFLFAAV